MSAGKGVIDLAREGTQSAWEGLGKGLGGAWEGLGKGLVSEQDRQPPESSPRGERGRYVRSGTTSQETTTEQTEGGNENEPPQNASR